MKIGYLVPDWPSQTHAFFNREIRALRELGHSVTIFSTRCPSPATNEHAFAAAARAETIYLFPPSPLQVFRWFSKHPDSFRLGLQYSRQVAKTSVASWAKMIGLAACGAHLASLLRAFGIEHLHVHSCADAAHLGALASRFSKVSYSLTLHGDLPVYGEAHFEKMVSASFVNTVTRPLVSQVKQIVGLENLPVRVVTMGVDSDYFTPLGARPADGAFRLITVARLNDTKGHIFALEAIHSLLHSFPQISYSIVGDGPAHQSIRDAVHRLGLQGVVTMEGRLSEENVITLLQRSDAFLLTSFGLGEAAPVSVMEAMSCALPVVCSRIGGTEDMIEDHVSGLLVPQKDVKAIAAAIRELILTPSRARAIGNEARRRAARLFDYRSTAAALANGISAAVSHGNG